jgi:hypothetical protein
VVLPAPTYTHSAFNCTRTLYVLYANICRSCCHAPTSCNTLPGRKQLPFCSDSHRNCCLGTSKAIFTFHGTALTPSVPFLSSLADKANCPALKSEGNVLLTYQNLRCDFPYLSNESLQVSKVLASLIETKTMLLVDAREFLPQPQTIIKLNIKLPHWQDYGAVGVKRGNIKWIILNLVACILLRVLDQVQEFPSNATPFQ